MNRRRTVAAHRTGPVRPSWPYRGLFSPPYNVASKLTIPTSNGSGAMHPDVIDFGASGWSGHRYWMAFTPYNGTAATEVPSVVVADSLASGGTWTVPSGYTNPLTSKVDPLWCADTDMVYDAGTDRLYVFYLVAQTDTLYDIRSKWTSGDGTWSTEVTVLSGGGTSYLSNPSLVKTATGWRMYYTTGGNTPATKLIYYRDTTGAPDSGYGAEHAVAVPRSPERMFQNINAVKDADGTHVLIVSDSDSGTVNGRMYFARTADGGDSFTPTGPEVLSAGASDKWDAGGIYRASLVVDAESTVVLNGSSLHLFYSGYRDGISTWGTGYVQVPVQFIRP